MDINKEYAVIWLDKTIAMHFISLWLIWELKLCAVHYRKMYFKANAIKQWNYNQDILRQMQPETIGVN